MSIDQQKAAAATIGHVTRLLALDAWPLLDIQGAGWEFKQDPLARTWCAINGALRMQTLSFETYAELRSHYDGSTRLNPRCKFMLMSRYIAQHGPGAHFEGVPLYNLWEALAWYDYVADMASPENEALADVNRILRELCRLEYEPYLAARDARHAAQEKAKAKMTKAESQAVASASKLELLTLVNSIFALTTPASYTLRQALTKLSHEASDVEWEAVGEALLVLADEAQALTRERRALKNSA